jgi:hypothetical protein
MAQEAYIKSSHKDGTDYFGTSVSLSSDGNTMEEVGAYVEDSSSTVVDGNQADNNADTSGAVYLY